MTEYNVFEDARFYARILPCFVLVDFDEVDSMTPNCANSLCYHARLGSTSIS